MAEEALPVSVAAGQADQYLLGDSTAEVQHLIHQAAVYAEEAGQLPAHVVASLGR